MTKHNVYKQWAETAENVKARSLVIDEYVKGYHGA
jgi:hypothetical protein